MRFPLGIERSGDTADLGILTHRRLDQFGQRAGADQPPFELVEAAQFFFIQARFIQQGLQLAAQQLVFSLQGSTPSG